MTPPMIAPRGVLLPDDLSLLLLAVFVPLGTPLLLEELRDGLTGSPVGVLMSVVEESVVVDSSVVDSSVVEEVDDDRVRMGGNSKRTPVPPVSMQLNPVAVLARSVDVDEIHVQQLGKLLGLWNIV